jgi:hypothetical protein
LKISHYSFLSTDPYISKNTQAEDMLMDAKEKKRKRERERYAQMTNEKKQERLKRFREAYHEKKKNKESSHMKETEADIVHHEDATIDARQDVHAAGGIEALENLKKELHLGKITSILSFFSIALMENITLFLLYILLIYRPKQYKKQSGRQSNRVRRSGNGCQGKKKGKEIESGMHR